MKTLNHKDWTEIKEAAQIIRDNLVSVREGAKLVDRSVPGIWLWLNQERIRTLKIGRARYIHKQDLYDTLKILESKSAFKNFTKKLE